MIRFAPTDDITACGADALQLLATGHDTPVGMDHRDMDRPL